MQQVAPVAALEAVVQVGGDQQLVKQLEGALEAPMGAGGGDGRGVGGAWEAAGRVWTAGLRRRGAAQRSAAGRGTRRRDDAPMGGWAGVAAQGCWRKSWQGFIPSGGAARRAHLVRPSVNS